MPMMMLWIVPDNVSIGLATAAILATPPVSLISSKHETKRPFVA
jgi:hypothetical protein